MQLFRRHFGPRDAATTAAGLTLQDKTDNIEKANDSLPPSYQDSQDASLRAVLQGAKAVVPLLWPSAFGPSSPITSSLSPSTLADEYQSLTMNKEPRIRKEKEKTGNSSSGLGAEENAIMEVLESLAMTACGDYPFLDRVRQFSDFYFTPYAASDGGVSSQENDPDSPTCQDTLQVAVPIQEEQRLALQNLNAPRDSAALVLCARVLEGYYAELGHADSTAGNPITENTYKPSPWSLKAQEAGHSTAGTEESATPPLPAQPGLKTRLTQISACAETGCNCFDFDEATLVPKPQAKTIRDTATPHANKNTNKPQRCTCGHPQTSHGGPAAGLPRLLRRYTNWQPESYTFLNHRSSSGREKRQIHEIEVCRAAPGGANCPCPDYDKGRRTGRCARCGHYDGDHYPIRAVQDHQAMGNGKEGKREKGGNQSTTGTIQKASEWELSWILVENAYLLLSQITPLLEDEKSRVS
ncbi:hypothetical protein F5Y10DRAFT_82424 [Nemania abortiva]|nr:hypothetical protein F5Y10DRAFT_82424 [Nemania abortiva]